MNASVACDKKGGCSGVAVPIFGFPYSVCSVCGKIIWFVQTILPRRKARYRIIVRKPLRNRETAKGFEIGQKVVTNRSPLRIRRLLHGARSL